MSKRAWIIVIATASCIVLATCCGVAGVFILKATLYAEKLDKAANEPTKQGNGQSATEPTNPKTEQASKGPAKKIIDRNEFRQSAVGLTADALLKKFGKPNSTHENGDGSPSLWTYQYLTRDSITEKTDIAATCWFLNGKVSRVSFTPGF